MRDLGTLGSCPSMVLTMLAKGASRDDGLKACPALEPEDIDAGCSMPHGSAKWRQSKA